MAVSMLTATHAGRSKPIPASSRALYERNGWIVTDSESDPSSAELADDLDALRAEAEAAGVTVNQRWGANRLRTEIEAANDG